MSSTSSSSTKSATSSYDFLENLLTQALTEPNEAKKKVLFTNICAAGASLATKKLVNWFFSIPEPAAPPEAAVAPEAPADINAEQKHNENKNPNQNPMQCDICCVHPKTRCCVPCGHTMCLACSQKLQNKPCPYCRQRIRHVITFFT